MLKNFLIVSARQFQKQFAYTALNVLSLTIGTVSCLIILLYLHHEISYDSYHERADNIYRISSRFSEPDHSFNLALTQFPLGPTVKEELSEISQYVRFFTSGRIGFSKDNETYFVEDFYHVDSTVFDVFSFDFIAGNPATALSSPNSIVLSKSVSDKIFKGENAIGQTLETENFIYTVTGIYQDQPPNSHIIARSMASLSTNERLINNNNWGRFRTYTYVVLHDIAVVDSVISKLNTQINQKYVTPILDQVNLRVVYDLMNIQDIHLKSDYEREPTPLGNQDYIYIFGTVAVFLILIACINYTNLATARSVRRSLEVGIRKVMGASRNLLIGQFLTESLIVSFISLILSIFILLIAVPLINQQLHTDLDLNLLVHPPLMLGILGLMVFAGLLSGAYPAFYLSAYPPVIAIKGGNSGRSGKVWVRKILICVQFSISVFMLSGTFIIYDQMYYVRNIDLGFDQNEMITFQMNRTTRQKWPVLRNRLMQNPSVLKAGTAHEIPSRIYSKSAMGVEQNNGVMEAYTVNLLIVDYDYFTTLGIKIIEGRDFSNDYITDTIGAVIVNQSMVKRLTWDEPLGKKILFSDAYYRIIGVAKDFHHLSLHNPIEHLAFFPNLNNENALVKVGGNIPETLKYIQETWKEFLPNIPLEYTFLDQTFLQAYEDDQIRGRIFLGLAIIMIIIPSLGLLGLASFIAEQRAKEVSIRKVLGAETSELVALLVKEFSWLVLIGAVPAFFVGYQIMDNWLQTFEYHVDVNPVLFGVVLLIVLLVTVLATGYHAYKAALRNPVDNLKYE